MEKREIKSGKNLIVNKGVRLTLKDSPALKNLLDVMAIIIAHDYTNTVRNNPDEFAKQWVKP